MVKAKSQSFLLADFLSPLGKLYDFAFTILHLYCHQLFYDYIQSWKTGEGCVKDCEGL
jgi:hypothetical protein